MRIIHPPRPGDLPREQLVAMAERAILAHGGYERVEAHFKFTCPACGTRCTLMEANTLAERGECCVCGEVSDIKVGGVCIHIKL